MMPHRQSNWAVAWAASLHFRRSSSLFNSSRSSIQTALSYPHFTTLTCDVTGILCFDRKMAMDSPASDHPFFHKKCDKHGVGGGNCGAHSFPNPQRRANMAVILMHNGVV
jgi:hypothetical protein